MYSTADFSRDRRYRFRLDRWWGIGPRVCWLMCNPSKADETRDDLTVKKCMTFSARWGYSGLTIVNRWDFVATSPAALIRSSQPESERNSSALRTIAKDCEEVIVAWGCSRTLREMRLRGHDVFNATELMYLETPYLKFSCLGLSKDGTPRHPSRIAYSTAREPFDWEKARQAMGDKTR
jgi:hypothetical protein